MMATDEKYQLLKVFFAMGDLNKPTRIILSYHLSTVNISILAYLGCSQ